jgi:hypothetical protein
MMDAVSASESPAVAYRPGKIAAVLLPLMMTAGVAVLHLPFPFWGDQAFTLFGAQAIDRGQTLYKDLWDVRQPGAAYFYWLAGRLFGFTEFGVHTLELLWMVAAAVVLVFIARDMVSRKWLAATVPLLTVGFYYMQASHFDLTQAEALLLLPLAVCLWCVMPHAGSPRRQALTWFAFGCASAVVAMFKLVVLVVPLTLAAIRIANLWTQERRRVGQWLSSVVLPGGAGFVLCVLPLIVHFWRRDALQIAYWTTFSFPRLALAELQHAPRWRLVSDCLWFGTPRLAGLPFLLLALRRRSGATQSIFMWLLCGWTAAAAVAIAAQSFTAWRYYFLLLVGPFGLLAAAGLDEALDIVKVSVSNEPGMAALMVLPLVLSMVVPIRPVLAAALKAVGHESFGEAFRADILPAYPLIQRSARLISTNPRPGTVFVFGDFRILLFAGRPQAIPLRGGALRSLLQRQWDTFPTLLAGSPPTFIYMGRSDAAYVAKRSPGVIDFLRTHYHVLALDELRGTWYERNLEAVHDPDTTSTLSLRSPWVRRPDSVDHSRRDDEQRQRRHAPGEDLAEGILHSRDGRQQRQFEPADEDVQQRVEHAVPALHVAMHRQAPG